MNPEILEFLSYSWTIWVIIGTFVVSGFIWTLFWMALKDNLTNRLMARDNLGRVGIGFLILCGIGTIAYYTLLPLWTGIVAFFAEIQWSWNMLLGLLSVIFIGLALWLKNKFY